VTNAIAMPALTPIVQAAERNIDHGASQIADGEAAARSFGDALQREAPLLLAAARAMTLDDAEAEDLVQTTFELALTHRASLRDLRALRSWLLVIQAREAFRITRRLRRLVRMGPDTREQQSPGPGPESVAVTQALATLSPKVRAAVVLHHMAGLPVADVARALGVSPNTVKSQLRTGLARLREVLSDD
jgi:RNA polymerase sigma-70 factor (ECF subfamily)